MRKNTTPIETRLMNRTQIQDGHDPCWLWQGAKNNIGFGMIRDGHQMRTVHRVSFEYNYNCVIPPDKVVYHLCNNYNCLNPDHLLLGTLHDKVQRSMHRGEDVNYPGRWPTVHASMIKTTCCYCKKTYPANLTARWHNEKCKHKLSIINAQNI